MARSKKKKKKNKLVIALLACNTLKIYYNRKPALNFNNIKVFFYITQIKKR